MDNGAYEKYKQENPDVYTPLSTYDYVDQFVHQLTPAEVVVCVVAAVLAMVALYKLFVKRKDKKKEDL
jgi:negative regulator of sigma E activity